MMFDSSKPLWMPEGSVRAILALIVVSAFISVCIYSGNDEAIGLIAVMIAKDYFQSKKTE